MNLRKLKKNWETLGRNDPMWAVLTNPAKVNNQWEAEEFFATGVTHVEQIFSRVDLRVIPLGQRALDFGCGVGRLSQALCARYSKVTGVDISSTMIAAAKKYNSFPDRCDYVVNAESNLSQFETSTFDLVFTYITLQHMEPRYMKAYIQEFIRVLKPGGHALFNIPTKQPKAYKLLIPIIGFKGLNLLRKLYFRKQAVIEMHWIPEEEMTDFLETCQVAVAKVVDDKGVGDQWESKLYLLKKTS